MTLVPGESKSDAASYRGKRGSIVSRQHLEPDGDVASEEGGRSMRSTDRAMKYRKNRLLGALSRWILFLIVFVATAFNLEAACHVVTPAGSGAKTGADWNNACAGFTGPCTSAGNYGSPAPAPPNGMVRGDTYYVAGSATSYQRSTVFNVADSGTSPITIKKATASDHCTDTGWNSSYGTLNAKWEGAEQPGGGLLGAFWSVCASDYWVFDGQTGDGTSNNPGEDGQYGFYFKDAGQMYGFISTHPQNCNGGSTGSTNVTFRHFELDGVSGAGIDATYPKGYYYNNPGATALFLDGGSSIMVDHAYTHDIAFMNELAADSTTFDHVWMARNYSSALEHANGIDNLAVSGTVSNLTVRYSVFEDISGTGHIMCLGNGAPCPNWTIYGNVFFNTGAFAGSTGPNGEPHGTSKITGDNNGSPPSNVTNMVFYNNTVDGLSGAGTGNAGIVIQYSGSTGNNIEDNLWFNTGSNITSMPSSSFATHDYNSFLNSAINFGLSPHEIQTASGSPDPFMNDAAKNFHLIADTAPGATLSSPYNVDPDGNIRSAYGVWDQGAYEFTGEPNPPTNLQATPH